MTFRRSVAVVLACAPLLMVAPVEAQENAKENSQQSSPPQAAPHPGRGVVMSKCFQCHTDTIFRDHRTDRRGWEAAIYRMVGRGGLWTADEIKVMADYLVTDFGPKPASQSK